MSSKTLAIVPALGRRHRSQSMLAGAIADRFHAARTEIGKAIVGQETLVDGVLVALFAQGSVLLEGPPGLGKTLLVNVLSRALSCRFNRVQFTPDLMPSDLTGHSIYDAQEERFHFQRGPVFTQLLLADEINRSPPKTQAALLEVMQEHQVTADGTTHRFEGPFLVIGTQNPIDHEGTYPLPQAAIDRFMFKLTVDYPSLDEESRILEHYARGRDPRELDGYGIETVMSAADVVAIQQSASRTRVVADVIRYVAEIVSLTRQWRSVRIGASPRGSVNLLVAARVLACCRGRDYVTPDDVKDVAPWVLRHRMVLEPDAELDGETPDEVVRGILAQVAPPRT